MKPMRQSSMELSGTISEKKSETKSCSPIPARLTPGLQLN